MKDQSCWTVGDIISISCASHLFTGHISPAARFIRCEPHTGFWTVKKVSDCYWIYEAVHLLSHQSTGTYQVDPDTPHRYMTASKIFWFFSSTKVPSRAIIARRPPPDPRTTMLGTLFWGEEDRKHQYIKVNLDALFLEQRLNKQSGIRALEVLTSPVSFA